jgi:hypothetical protein
MKQDILVVVCNSPPIFSYSEAEDQDEEGEGRCPKFAFIFFSQERRLTLKVERPESSITDASKILRAEWRTH